MSFSKFNVDTIEEKDSLDLANNLSQEVQPQIL